MGYYIQGPAIGKANFLINEHGAREVSDRKDLLIGQIALGKEALICVVFNGTFDAAAFVHSQKELDDFLTAGDRRPKRWLVMDLAKAKVLSGYNQ